MPPAQAIRTVASAIDTVGYSCASSDATAGGTSAFSTSSGEPPFFCLTPKFCDNRTGQQAQRMRGNCGTNLVLGGVERERVHEEGEDEGEASLSRLAGE